MAVGCNDYPERNKIKVIQKPEGKFQKYEYYDGYNWLFFYDTIGAHQVGDTIK